MNSFKFKTSITKNWPGGRRNARILKDLSPTKSVLVWKYPWEEKNEVSDSGVSSPNNDSGSPESSPTAETLEEIKTV